jgi:DNA-binding HxlR family transcriptional regulator
MSSVSTCRVDSVLRVIGDRWALGIIHKLSLGPRRTLDLHGSFVGLSTKTLADRLKRLEQNGIVRRVSYKETPPRVEYSLTEKGRRLLPVIEAISSAALGWEPEREDSCKACGPARPPRDLRPARKKTDVTLL